MCGSNVSHEGARRFSTHPKESNGKMLIVGMTEGDCRDSIVDGESGLIATADPDFKPWLINRSGNLSMVWPNGFRAYLRTGQNPEKIRSLNVSLTWLDEFAHFQHPKAAWNNARFAMRKGKHPELVITTTPLPSKLLTEIMEMSTTHVIRGSMFDNAANLNAEYVRELEEELGGTELGDQELHGIVLPLTDWALWKSTDFQRMPFSELPELVEVVIGIDPAGGTASKKNDETGIIAVGKDVDDNFYFLQDLSTKAGSAVWSVIATKLAMQMRTYSRKVRIIGESNFGGDMVLTCISSCKEFRDTKGRVKLELVRAIVSKGERATPVAQRYKLGRVFHVGPHRHWTRLEHQMCSWEPGKPRSSQKSPDRMDSAVHACAALIGDGGGKRRGQRGLAKARARQKAKRESAKAA